MAIGDLILASDYNDIRNLAVTLIGTGSGTRGYGQFVYSGSAIPVGTKVTPGLFNTLRADLFNIRSHQIGTAPALIESAAVGNIVTEADKIAFTNYANSCDTNRLTADSTRVTTATAGSSSRTASWSNSVSCTITQNFMDAETARFFYNTGGYVMINSSRTGGAASSQNTSWSNLLSSSSGLIFNASNFYSQSNSNVTFYTSTASSPYSSNRYTITTRSNVANNSNGGATIITFTIVWDDPYVDPSPGNPPAPEDVVDGTLSVTFVHRYAQGGMAMPGGGVWRGFEFAGTGGGSYSLPTYNFSSIVGG